MDLNQSSHSVQQEHPSSTLSVHTQHLKHHLFHHSAACGGSLLPDGQNLTILNFQSSVLLSARSSLDLGHGGIVLGQDLHQFVSPVKRVPEPAQLSRDLGGVGDLCEKQIPSHRSDHTRKKGSNSSRPSRTLTLLGHFYAEEARNSACLRAEAVRWLRCEQEQVPTIDSRASLNTARDVKEESPSPAAKSLPFFYRPPWTLEFRCAPCDSLPTQGFCTGKQAGGRA